MTMEKYYSDCDLLTGKNSNNINYDYCIECYRYETCKQCFNKGENLMTLKNLKKYYGYKKRMLEKINKVCIIVPIEITSRDDALKLANDYFHMNKRDLIITKGFATARGSKAYLKKKITVFGEKPCWIIYRR